MVESSGSLLTLDEFFGEYSDSRFLFDRLLPLINHLGQVECKITRSQIAFHRKRPFAWVWIPAKWLRGKVAPLVLSLALTSRDPSPRWKEIVETSRGKFMHHLEIDSIILTN